MSDLRAEFTSDNIKTNEGISELNRILNILLFDNGTTTDFFFNIRSGLELTISGGIVLATSSRHLIDTESDGASDDLDTINGGSDGDILIISAANSSRTVVVKDGTGNISCAGDFTMDHADDRIGFMNDGTNWVELFRSANA